MFWFSFIFMCGHILEPKFILVSDFGEALADWKRIAFFKSFLWFANDVIWIWFTQRHMNWDVWYQRSSYSRKMSTLWKTRHSLGHLDRLEVNDNKTIYAYLGSVKFWLFLQSPIYRLGFYFAHIRKGDSSSYKQDIVTKTRVFWYIRGSKSVKPGGANVELLIYYFCWANLIF